MKAQAMTWLALGLEFLVTLASDPFRSGLHYLLCDSCALTLQRFLSISVLRVFALHLQVNARVGCSLTVFLPRDFSLSLSLSLVSSLGCCRGTCFCSVG